MVSYNAIKHNKTLGLFIVEQNKTCEIALETPLQETPLQTTQTPIPTPRGDALEQTDV